MREVFGNTCWAPSDVDIVITLPDWEKIEMHHDSPRGHRCNMPVVEALTRCGGHAENYLRVIPKEGNAYYFMIYHEGKQADVVVVPNSKLRRDMVQAKRSCNGISSRVQRHLRFEQYLLKTGRWKYVEPKNVDIGKPITLNNSKVVFTEESQYCYALVHTHYVHFAVYRLDNKSTFSFWCTHGAWGGECDKFGALVEDVTVSHTGEVVANLTKGRKMFFKSNITEDKVYMK